jgi:hypothetical protein
LHKAVDQRGLDVSARRAHDAARANGTGVQVFQENRLVLGAILFLFNRGQCPCHTGKQVFYASFAGFEILLSQYVVADGLDHDGILRGIDGVAFHIVMSLEVALGAANAMNCHRLRHYALRAMERDFGSSSTPVIALIRALAMYKISH